MIFTRLPAADRVSAVVVERLSQRQSRRAFCYTDGWSELDRGPDGKIIPDRTKFPSGVQHVSDYIHSKGNLLSLHKNARLARCCCHRPAWLPDGIDSLHNLFVMICTAITIAGLHDHAFSCLHHTSIILPLLCSMLFDWSKSAFWITQCMWHDHVEQVCWMWGSRMACIVMHNIVKQIC